MSVTFGLERDPLGPVEPGVVAMLRLPMPITGVDRLVKALETMYGRGLVVRTDTPNSANWMVIAKPEPATPGGNA